MNWLNNLFLTKKTLEQVRQWTAAQHPEQVVGVTSLIVKLDELAKQREELLDKQESLQQQLAEANKRREQLKQEKDQVTGTQEYQTLKEQLLTAKKTRQEAEQAINAVFTPLQPAIASYADRLKEEKLAHYASNPVNTLIYDYSLELLKHVPAISSELHSGTLKMPDKEAAINAIKQLNKDNLGKLIHSYANAKKGETALHQTLPQRPLMQDYERKLNALKEAEKERDVLQQEMGLINIPVEEELKMQLNTELAKHKLRLI